MLAAMVVVEWFKNNCRVMCDVDELSVEVERCRCSKKRRTPGNGVASDLK